MVAASNEKLRAILFPILKEYELIMLIYKGKTCRLGLLSFSVQVWPIISHAQRKTINAPNYLF